MTAVLWFLPAGGIHILKPYQQDRLTAFLHPNKDPSGSGYNIIQSKIGVGAGGLTGRGISGSTQTNFNYLPEHATDFAFSSMRSSGDSRAARCCSGSTCWSSGGGCGS